MATKEAKVMDYDKWESEVYEPEWERLAALLEETKAALDALDKEKLRRMKQQIEDYKSGEAAARKD